ncbi:MAG: integrase core domain-containing protein [Gilliamella sp.]|nr:integrase core domain-containing protein [Gilliamella sp.]
MSLGCGNPPEYSPDEKILKTKELKGNKAAIYTQEQNGVEDQFCYTLHYKNHEWRIDKKEVYDDFNREALGINIAVSLPAGRITRYLDKLAEYHGYPLKIRVDNGPEFTGKTFINWAKSHDITIDYIQPGSPYQNGYIERFNRTYRTEVLDLYLFNNLAQARRITEEWLTIYNTERPHEALNNMTPIEYKTLKQAAWFST